jgi:hypothetical protein
MGGMGAGNEAITVKRDSQQTAVGCESGYGSEEGSFIRAKVFEDTIGSSGSIRITSKSHLRITDRRPTSQSSLLNERRANERRAPWAERACGSCVPNAIGERRSCS